MSLFERGLNITIISGLKMMRIHLFCDKVEKFTLPETVAACTCNKRWLEDFSLLILLGTGFLTGIVLFSESLLGGGFKYFLFSPYLGKIPILTNIFQVG